MGVYRNTSFNAHLTWGREKREKGQNGERKKEREKGGGVKQYTNVGVHWSTSFNAHFHS